MSILKIKNGNQWVNIPTIKGDDGKSAYEYAVDGGYTGTSTEFAQKLADEYVKTTDYATQTNGGITKVVTSGYYGVVMGGTNNQFMMIYPAPSATVKAGSTPYQPIAPATQHVSTFYGLAKAAGDTTQSASNNAVGTYTAEAKTAIHTMLGIESPAITVDVQGASPIITAQPNVRYVCGEVTSISITPPSIGTCDVIFTSGSTVAVLTLPNTVKTPDWFDASSLNTNTIYEINIVDGVYGAVMTWTL